MRRETPLVLVLLLAPLLAGCIAGRADAGTDLAFSAPVALNPPGGWGYEPSIKLDGAGTLFVTAHKSSLVAEGTRLSSWLWYSDDGGATWRDMPSPDGREKAFFAFEGDLAVDALDRLYFVDTYAGDNTISRWLPGPTWDYSVPVMPTSGVDDRPWIAAHGDGIVHYLGNNGVALVAPGDVGTSGSTVPPPSRYFLTTSTDGGRTWSLGHAFPNALWCHVAASPVDDVTVLVVCTTDESRSKVVAFRSGDRGATWTRTTLGTMRGNPGEFATVAFDRAGHAYTAWIDMDAAGDKLLVARSASGGAWKVEEIPGTPASMERVWVAGGDAGTVAVSYYGSTDARTTRSSDWHLHTLVSADAAGAGAPTWQAVLVDPIPVTRGASSPADFFQNAIGPDNRVYVAYGRDNVGDLAHVIDYTQDILVVRQTAGPNLA